MAQGFRCCPTNSGGRLKGERLDFALVGQPAAAQGGMERTVGKVLKHRASGRRRKQPRTERLPGATAPAWVMAEGHLGYSGVGLGAPVRAGE